MSKGISLTAGGIEMYLLYTIDAEAFIAEYTDELLPDGGGGITEIFKLLDPASCRDWAKHTAVIGCKLAETGELARREYGYDHREIPDPGSMRKVCTVADMATLGRGIMTAVCAGITPDYQMAADPEKPRDLTLEEIEKKTKRG